MKKINIAFFFLLFASQLLFSNVFSSYKKVSVIKTQYFDIIFPQEAQQTAEIIINKADFLFESACQNFQLEKKIQNASCYHKRFRRLLHRIYTSTI